MIRTTILSISLFVAAGACLAQSPAAAPLRGAQHPQLDRNGDGAIDRSEAAAMPRLAERFDQLDRNRDGRIDASERPQRKGKGGRHGKGGIAKLDTNGDGQLSRQEVAGKRKLADAFASMDTDRNGLLSRAELGAWKRQQKGDRGDRGNHYGQKFTAADTDRDGRLSRSEVAALPKLAERFVMLDSNRDGYLDRQELNAARQHRKAGMPGSTR